MKKLFAVLLALTLVLSMGTIALATDGNTPATGSITITNASKDAKYDLYRIFDLVSYDADKGTYSYKLSENWKNFTNDAFEVNDNGYIEWVVDDTDNGDAVNAFVKDALAYAQNPDNNISADADATATADGSLTINNLPLGYYLIDTSLGTLCSITTTNPNAEVTEKNQKPDIDKFVQEDSEMTNADEGWGKVNDADIDQVVNYKSTITVGVGATNYVMHDTMEAGLTFNNDVVVKLADGTPVDAANYTVTVSPADGHTFDVAFNNDFIAGLGKGDTFTVYYSATLNENANIVDEGNDNTVYLSYGEDSTWETAEHKTTTYTWKMDVLKYAGTDKTPLAGAKFQLLDKDGNAIKFTEVTGEAVPTYKVDAEGTVTEITTNANGKFELVGLDEGTYKLHETEAPAGYNKLAADINVVITSEYDETALTATYEINDETPATIEVENKTGSLLPETGGIGTTIFYVVGSILMLAALVLLVSKKRMANFA